MTELPLGSDFEVPITVGTFSFAALYPNSGCLPVIKT